MADELKGKIYEIFSIIAIKRYSNIILEGEKLFWNERPKDINIEPDITVGRSADDPRLLMLVAHTAAERSSGKKFWRNMGEFVDARLAFGDRIRIISVTFDSVQKRKLAAASGLMFDGMIEVDRRPYGRELIEFADRLVLKYEAIKTPLDARAEMIEELIDSGEGKNLIQSLAKDRERVSSNRSSNSTGWYSAFSAAQKEREYRYMPDRKNTYIRRGIGRLLPIDDEAYVQDIVSSIREGKPLEKVPDYFVKLGLAAETDAGYEITRRIPRGKKKNANELYYSVGTLSDEDILNIWSLSRFATTALNQVCEEINTGLYARYHSFVADCFDELIKPDGLSKALADCYDSPGRVLGQSIAGIPNNWRAWLFDFIMTIVKAYTGKQQGYGYSKLVVDAGLHVPNKRSILDFALPAYNSRSKMPEERVLRAVASALSEKLANIGKEWVQDQESLIHAFYLRTLFEDKIYKAAFYDPIQLLLKAKMPDLKLISRYPTVLSDLLQSQNSTCFVFKAADTIIMWQSAYDANCGHKFNELVGRIGMLRTKTDEFGEIVPRSSFKRALLVIDGTWSVKQIQCLHRAGFDGIFYPDELDKLADAII